MQNTDVSDDALASNDKPDALPEAAVLAAIVTDEHAGKGGTYIFDPVTGTRTHMGGTVDQAPAEGGVDA